MKITFILVCFIPCAFAQSWSTFLDPSRAIDWTGAGFTIPSYTVPCATQPTLLTGSGNASANTTAIQNSLSSCDSTHNVVNLSSGTYYFAGITFPDHGAQVLRGAGSALTKLIATTDAPCSGISGSVCMSISTAVYDGNAQVLPPSGTQQCLWSAGYSQGAASITLTSCGGAPPIHQMIVLDQANDVSDTGGVYICDSVSSSDCTYNSPSSSNINGRVISGISYSQQQVTYTTSVVSLGGGSYTVTIAPGVYFTNVRSGQTPGAWWAGTAIHNGVENLYIDGTSTSFRNFSIYACYQCWVKNVTSLFASRAHVGIGLSMQSVVRDSYFYQAQSQASNSYAVEVEESSAFLIENNIFQQTTIPVILGQASGGVTDYNFSIDDQFANNFLSGAYATHNAGNEFNLWEGNNIPSILADDAWGTSAQQTIFRNMFPGWAAGRTQATFPISLRSFNRAFNSVGNVIGQPGYHNQYQAYTTSSSGGVGQPNANTSIYELGWSDAGGTGVCTSPPACDSLVFPTMMRWGNYDTVNAATRWDSTEASPGAVPYASANFSSGYFGSLAHTLPASLYYTSKPSWWPSSKAWPAIGPDVSTGNVGTCSGTYSGAQATASSQCTGGTLSSAWASHINSIPAQDCYLNIMGGVPDGSGVALTFDSSACYPSGVASAGAVCSGPCNVFH